MKELVCMFSSFVRHRVAVLRLRWARTALIAAVVLAAAAVVGVPVAAASAARPQAEGTAGGAVVAPGVRAACGPVGNPFVATCTTLVRTDIRQRTEASLDGQQPTGYGYGPADLQSAYNLTSASATDGAGQTVAVVTAYDDPNIVSDLAAYRAAWGQPPCDPSTGAGCLTKVNQYGKSSPLPAPAGTTGWATEQSTDVDMISAICPLCHILMVEAKEPNGYFALGHSVNSAVALGARYVDNPWIAEQYSIDPSLDAMYFDHPGDAIVTAAGNTGYFVGYPNASQYVVAVGGTSLLQDSSTSRGWEEHVWGSATSKLGTGSGCSSKYEPKPPWQPELGCKRRVDNDVSAVANPHDGVAVYDTYDQHGWFEAGGTGVSSSIITAVFALAGPPAAGTYPASYLYAAPEALYNVTIGSDGTCPPAHKILCTAEPGYNGPSGMGTPDGIYAFGYHG
jgi:hypothetical protein